jgi:hypothetical protein
MSETDVASGLTEIKRYPSRVRLISWALLWPFTLTSVPFAYFAGVSAAFIFADSIPGLAGNSALVLPEGIGASAAPT